MFRARAGQVIYFDDQNGDYNFLAWTLLDPDGEPVFNDQSLFGNGDLSPVTLKTAGKYELSVSGRGDAVGGYTFELFDVSNPLTASMSNARRNRRPGTNAVIRPPYGP